MSTKHVVLVGEAFGREEEAYGRPFIGPSGQLLISALRECGLERYDVHITNVCMFRPTDENGDNRPPVDEEIAQERPRLYADIKKFTTIICLGRTAHDVLSPLSGAQLSSCLGRKLTNEFGQTVVTIWHPAYILRNRHLMPEYVSLLKGALK